MIDDIRAEMEAAFAADDESAPSSEVTTPEPEVVSSDPAQTEPTASPQPSDTGEVVAAPEKAGPIPFDRHKAALDNARAKAAEEAEAKYRWLQQYGDQNALQTRLSVLQRAEQDPAGFARDFLHAAGIDPRTLVQQAAPQPAQDPRPDPDILLENGQTTYSHERLQQLLEWERRQLTSQFQSELAPIKQERVVKEMQEKSLGQARQLLATAAQWPGFAEHKDEIKALLKSDPHITLHDAYIKVVPQKLTDQAYQKALADLQQKAGAASTPAARVTGTAPADPASMSIRDALEYFATQ